MSIETPSALALTRYRVQWADAQTPHSVRTTECVVNSEHLARPGDEDELRLHLRKILANRWLPIGRMRPENIALHLADPLCNCEPYPQETNCAYAQWGGSRFALEPAQKKGWEWITDRGTHTAVGQVCTSLSVDFLTLVRRTYGHQ